MGNFNKTKAILIKKKAKKGNFNQTKECIYIHSFVLLSNISTVLDTATTYLSFEKHKMSHM